MRKMSEKEIRKQGEVWLSIGAILALMRTLNDPGANRLDTLTEMKSFAHSLKEDVAELIAEEEDKDEQSVRNINVLA